MADPSLSDQWLIADLKASDVWLPIMRTLHAGVSQVTEVMSVLDLARDEALDALDDLDYEGLVVVCDDLNTCRLSPRGQYILEELAKV